MKRANDEIQKQARRNAILDSALILFEAEDNHLPTVAAIAKNARIAKGTVYLYFQTREEIYLTLLGNFIDGWFTNVTRLTPGTTINTFIDLICDYIEQHPPFMRLSSIFNGILEKNISYKTAYEFKSHLRDQAICAAEIISRHFPEITVDQTLKRIIRSFAMSIGLWQLAEPAPILKQLLKKEEMKPLKIDFYGELKKSLTAIWNNTL